jgi:hypothetical protein
MTAPLRFILNGSKAPHRKLVRFASSSGGGITFLQPIAAPL